MTTDLPCLMTSNATIESGASASRIKLLRMNLVFSIADRPGAPISGRHTSIQQESRRGLQRRLRAEDRKFGAAVSYEIFESRDLVRGQQPGRGASIKRGYRHSRKSRPALAVGHDGRL